MVKDNSFGIAPLQDKMLDILKFFIQICKENDLRYMAGGGTCLGALRHNGFIPWDDDLDVFMPRPDYEKLWNIWNHNYTSSKYKLCRTTKETNYHHRVMQMVDLTTTFINKRNINEDIEHGIYIDIIPLDVCEENPIKRIGQIFNSIIYSVYNVQCIPEYNGGGLMRKATAILLGIIKSPDKRYKIWKRAEKKMIVGNWDNCENIVELTTILPSLLHKKPRKWFEIIQTPFEDIDICIPSGADEWMKSIYGDYMKLPPIEKRKVRHNTVYIDLEKPYTEYKGKYYCKQ